MMGEELNVNSPSELEIEKTRSRSQVSCWPWSLQLWVFGPAYLTLAVMVWIVTAYVVKCLQQSKVLPFRATLSYLSDYLCTKHAWTWTSVSSGTKVAFSQLQASRM